MNNFGNSVMIALLPTTTDWCRIELPHMTLVYGGEKDDLKPTAFNEMAKDASSIAMLSNPVMLQVLGAEVFGDEDKVDVLTLRPTQELLAMRQFVKFWNKSEYDFNPHVTVGPQGSQYGYVPELLIFDRIGVFWGKEQLIFRFKV